MRDDWPELVIGVVLIVWGVVMWVVLLTSI